MLWLAIPPRVSYCQPLFTDDANELYDDGTIRHAVEMSQRLRHILLFVIEPVYDLMAVKYAAQHYQPFMVYWRWLLV